MKKTYTEKDILEKFEKLDPAKKIKVLEKALKMALQNSAGTRGYAIASTMGYAYQDGGYYTK